MANSSGKNGSSGRPATQIVHLGRAPSEQHGFVNTPVYRGSTVLFPTLKELKSRKQAFTYGRRATPTSRALEEALNALSGGAYAMLTSSGLAAVSTALLAFAQSGDHILMVDTVYQPTRSLCDGLLARMGVETEYYDPLVGAGIAKLFRSNTKLVFVESPGSQTFEIQDLPAISAAARARNIWVLADNTWASPLYAKPLALGADVVIEALTKYVVGHADAMAGAVIANSHAAKVLDAAKEALGTAQGSEETFLALRGLRTLDVRLERHMKSGIAMATWLEGLPEVAHVFHPALPSHPQHALWKRDFVGASGLFSVVLKNDNETALGHFLDDLKLFGMGYSWGGFESLVIPFNPTSYRTATKWTFAGHALRFHIGLENIEDLKADLAAGFDRLNAAV